MFVCVFLQETLKNMGFQPILATVFGGFLGAKSRVNNWATVGSIIGPHVGPFFRHMWPSYWPKNIVKLWSFISCSKNIFLPAENKKTVAQSLTQQRAKCGPVIHPTAHIYIYICIDGNIYAVELKTGPRFGRL